MHCPVCHTAILTPTHLEDALKAQQCRHCDGHWLSADDYWRWFQQHGPTLLEKAPDGPTLELAEPMRVTFCLDCGDLMLKYRVGHGVAFHLDRCSRCGGIWFDQNEWTALEQRNLHDEMHFIFSDSWQRKNRQDQLRQVAKDAFRSALGEENFKKSLTVKAWLDPHPQADVILSLLTYCAEYYRSMHHRPTGER